MLKISFIRFLCVLLGILGGNGLYASDGKAKGVNRQDLMRAVQGMKGKEVYSVADKDDSVDEKTRAKIEKKRESLRATAVSTHYDPSEQKFITETAARIKATLSDFSTETNKTFQSSLAQDRKKSFVQFKKDAKIFGYGGYNEEQLERRFAHLWFAAMNQPLVGTKTEYEIEDEKTREMFREKGREIVSKEVTYQTTLLNKLLRSGVSELAAKVATFIEYGADRNLNPVFGMTDSMETQEEYPIRIVLEMEDKKVRALTLTTLLNDKIRYKPFGDKKRTVYNEETEKEEEEVYQDQAKIEKGVFDSIKKNYIYILKKLVDDRDFLTYNSVFDYVENRNGDEFYFIGNKTISSKNIDDQIEAQVLEYILEKMKDLRALCQVTGEDGFREDFLEKFFESPDVAKKQRGFKKIPEKRFNLGFQSILKTDVAKLFKHVLKKINDLKLRNQSLSELDGEKFQGYVQDWTALANFALRYSEHLNAYALGTAVKQQQNLIVRLIKYVFSYEHVEGGYPAKELELKFYELYACGGQKVIFSKTNDLKWTPLMYAMANRQSEKIIMMLTLTKQKLWLWDAMHNNIVHLAFPLGENHYKEEAKADTENVNDLVGANIGAEGSEEKATEAVLALIDDKNGISVEDKVKALTQESLARFTPVSLAAATGYLEAFNKMKGFLVQHGKWDENDHSRLTLSVNQIMVEGLENLRESKRRHNLFKDGDVQYFETQISDRRAAIAEREAKAISTMYHAQSKEAQNIFGMIKKPMMEILNTYDPNAAKSVSPYPRMLQAACDEMKDPKKKKQVIDYGIATPAKKKKKKLWPHEKWKLKREQRRAAKAHGGKKALVNPETAKPVHMTDVKFVNDLHAGLEFATADVIATYVREAIDITMKEYLKVTKNPKKLTLRAAYEGLTGDGSLEFFKNHFGTIKIERLAQAKMIEILKKHRRFKEERTDEDEDEDESGFGEVAQEFSDDDGMVEDQTVQVDESGFDDDQDF